MSGKSIFGGVVVLAAAVVAYVLASMHFGTFDPRGFFPAEPGVRQLADLSETNAKAELGSLLNGSWEYVCFVRPYYDVAGDEELADVEISWGDDDGYNTVVLKKGADYELHKFARSEISIFELTGLPEDQACYDGTALLVEHVSTDGDGFKTLRVTPQ